ncbi:hypothetical protein W03_00810 [Nitrosomonas sp. PY1]|uniref:DNA-3-methyladenine glycosylase 2 n=1 Tax=Nitrosomonas sp. PY1 TaxID=1803906 RepID=UPI001FC88585|nr:AlkA N-terminal domain-containing protein [Nitrosomonas sp. PY1]GKS68077.1 hypothetical protein W03_00810 [Nitrosomonas sp. PY1]
MESSPVIKTQLTCKIELPKHYHINAILAFHQRDPQAIAEYVNEHSLTKGLLWNEQPACLTIHFQSGVAQAQLTLDGTVNNGDSALLSKYLHRLLGLTQAIEEFEQCFRNHPELGPMLRKQTGLRIPTTFSVFEAISWAIIGQQISVNAAVSIRRKLIRYTDISHSSGLLCYPNAERIAQLRVEELRNCGLSLTKAEALLTVSRMLSNGELHFTDEFTVPPIDSLQRQLGAVRGIGLWTINYVLLRGFGWLDASLHGDVAVRRGLQKLLASPNKMSEKQVQQWLEQFSPWRALVAVHLWSLGSVMGA